MPRLTVRRPSVWLVSTALGVAACGGPAIADIRPNEVIPAGTVSHPQQTGVFVVNADGSELVAFKDTDPATGCALRYEAASPATETPNRSGVPGFVDTCDGSRYGLDGLYIEGPSQFSLSPATVRITVDGRVLAGAELADRLDRDGRPAPVGLP